MAGMVSLKTIGKWDKQIGVPLRDALAVSMDITGRTGEQACQHAIILMAQSARSLTPQAKKRRRVHRTKKKGEYILFDKPGKRQMEIRKWMFDYLERSYIKHRFKSWDQAQQIKSRGLAKRSWMWGLKGLSAKPTGKAIPGVGTLAAIKLPNLNGYVLSNRLDYITKVMPSGWEHEVARRAGNKVMAQARNKLQNKWRKAMNMPRGAKISNENLSRFFLKV